MNFLKMYLIAFVIFLLIDFIWLAFVAKDVYRKYLGFLMKDSPNYVAAIIFYLVFIVGLVYFVIMPGIEAQSIGKILLGGVLFGFITYATYDLTNLATVKDWPLTITIIDLIWGSFLSTSISVATYYLYQLIW